MNNLLIVESDNDRSFMEALIKYMNMKLEIGEPVCRIDEYECLGGMRKLQERLNALEHKILKGELDKVGIIFDADNEGIALRKQQIEEKIAPFKEKYDEVNFFIYIQNVDGHGELETLLKAIKSQDSTIANCLKAWQACLPEEKKIKPKEFDKFWIQIYQRYDCCTQEEKKQAGSKCNNESSMKKEIWNFDHPLLEELKTFLHRLSDETPPR